MNTVSTISFRHLQRLTDDRGLFEHALLAEARRDDGYCLDDVARALVVVTREPAGSPELDRLADLYLRFVEHAIAPDGLAHNRMDAEGSWTDEPAMGDWWGRAIAALACVVTQSPRPWARVRASYALQRALRARSTEARTMSFAALGAAQLVGHGGDWTSATALLVDAARMLPTERVPAWNWPEPRLRYANATLAEALLAVGDALGDSALVSRALSFLGWLLDRETRDGHLSVTGHAGAVPSDTGAAFDQQAIEVAAMADACALALRLTGNERWRTGVRLSWQWFEGRNDSGATMFDPETGAGYDGLEAHGRNENRGAESTIAAISTFQRARECGAVLDAHAGRAR